MIRKAICHNPREIAQTKPQAAPDVWGFWLAWFDQARATRKEKRGKMRQKKKAPKRQLGRQTGHGAQFTAQNCTPTNGNAIVAHGAPAVKRHEAPYE